MWCSGRESSASSRHFGLQSELQESQGYIMSSCLKSVTHQVTDRFSLMFDALGLGLLKNFCCNLPFCFSTDFFLLFFLKWSFLHTRLQVLLLCAVSLVSVSFLDLTLKVPSQCVSIHLRGFWFYTMMSFQDLLLTLACATGLSVPEYSGSS